MEPKADTLLLQLARPIWSAERHQLLWRCSLSQEAVLQVVPHLMVSLDCSLVATHSGADRIGWQIDFEGARLSLNFEALCDCLWLEPCDLAGQEVMLFLAELVNAQHEST